MFLKDTTLASADVIWYDGSVGDNDISDSIDFLLLVVRELIVLSVEDL